MNILVSACLLGVNCKYSGGNNENDKILELLKDNVLIPVCPEQLGGLGTPREPNEIIGGNAKDVIAGIAKVMDNKGNDVTEAYIKGAQEVLKIAKLYNCHTAVLKARSPSCGYNKIYDGTFSGKLIHGNGICTQLLLDNDIDVKTEENI